MKTNTENLEQLRLETKIVGLTRVKEALEKDAWSDVAKLGKDAYSAIVKEEVSIKAERAVRLQMVSALGDTEALTRLLKADPELASLLEESKRKALGGKTK